MSKKEKSKAGACCAEERKDKKRSKMKPKPKGMRWVNPYLTVRDVAKALEWYEHAFGFKVSVVMPGPDGKPVHAEMRYKKSVVMMGPEGSSHGEKPARAPGKDGVPVTLFCYCDDVDALCASAKVAGGKIAEEPKDQFWGDRTCFVVDPEGHQWMFATHVFDMDPDAAPPEPCCAGHESAAATSKPAEQTKAPVPAKSEAAKPVTAKTDTPKPAAAGAAK